MLTKHNQTIMIDVADQKMLYINYFGRHLGMMT